MSILKTDWISIEDQLPSDALMIKEDILICLEDGTRGIGSFIIEDGKIQRMAFNGTRKHIDYWGYKPTHWMSLPPQP